MFEHFTFGPMATSDYPVDPEDDREVSPSDCYSLVPAPVTSFPVQSCPSVDSHEEDIVCRFAQQSLLPLEADAERPQRSFCVMDVQDDGPLLEQTGHVSPMDGMMVGGADAPAPSKTRPNEVCRRLKRQQMNLQLVSSSALNSSHIKDINTLVEDMIVSESQCVLRRPNSRPQLSTSPTHPISDLSSTNSPLPPLPHHLPQPRSYNHHDEAIIIEIDEDEGFIELDDNLWNADDEMSLRRAGAPSGIGKYNGIRWRRSCETGGGPGVGPGGVPGRVKVRSVPRMRRRKTKPPALLAG